MGVILCATRGGEASYPAQDAAIALAKQAGAEVVFVHIYDVEFLAHANHALREDIVSEELDHMSEFLMTMAVERATAAGVPARFWVGHGGFRDQLLEVMRQERAQALVLGRPGDDAPHFEFEHLVEFAGTLQQESGIPVRILPA